MSKQRGVFEKVPGSGDWWVRYADVKSRIRREKAGTKSAALTLYRKRKTETLQRKKLPEKLREAPVPFAEIADAAIGYIKGRYARPSDDVARMVLLKKYFSGSANAITPGDVEDILDSLTAEKRWSASSRNHHQNLLSLAYRLAILHGKVNESPLRGLKRKSEISSRRVRFLTPAEEKQLRAAIRSKPEWAEHEPELDLALHTGLRRGSMYCDLVWENIDTIGRTLTIPRTKNGESITLPLNQDAMRALNAFRSRGDGKGRVVRNAIGEPLNYPGHWFRPAVRAAGIRNFHWHDLRHCYASRLRQAGVPLGNIAELLGHKGLAMTLRYAHLSISNLHEAVSRISTDTTTSTGPKHEISEKPEYVN